MASFTEFSRDYKWNWISFQRARQKTYDYPSNRLPGKKKPFRQLYYLMLWTRHISPVKEEFNRFSLIPFILSASLDLATCKTILSEIGAQFEQLVLQEQQAQTWTKTSCMINVFIHAWYLSIKRCLLLNFYQDHSQWN